MFVFCPGTIKHSRWGSTLHNSHVIDHRFANDAAFRTIFDRTIEACSYLCSACPHNERAKSSPWQSWGWHLALSSQGGCFNWWVSIAGVKVPDTFSYQHIDILTEVFNYCRHRRFALWRSCRSYQVSQPSDSLSLLRYSLVCMRFHILVYAFDLFLKLFDHS